MSPGIAFAIGLGAVALALGAAGISQLRSHNANMVDPIWAVTLGGVGLWLAAVGPSSGWLRIVLAASAGIWA
jgi:steroid 5-alpha reductase family enzyme